MDEQLTSGNGTLEPAGRAQSDQTWLVQVEDLSEAARDRDVKTWVDVGEVVVAPRTRRRTIVEKALEAYPSAAPAKDGKNPFGGGVAFRVLDADSAAEIPVHWEVPPAPEPVLRIGVS